MLNAHTYTLTIKKTNQKLHTQFKTTHTLTFYTNVHFPQI